MTTIVSTGTFDAARLLAGYEISGDGVLTRTDTALEWNLLYPGNFFPGAGLRFSGTEFEFRDGVATGGVVTGVEVIFDRYDPEDPSAVLAGFSVPLANVVGDTDSGEFDALALLETALAGNDTMTLSDRSAAFGDRLDVLGGRIIFGADKMELSGEDGTLWGDARTIAGGAEATGGNDRLIASGTGFDGVRLLGEVQTLTDASLTGGADWIKMTAMPDAEAGFVQTLGVGDAQELQGAAELIGGNDTLLGSGAMGDRLFGDAEVMLTGVPTLVGGDDLLKGRGGHDLLYGDVDNLAAGVLTGGNDTLIGGTGNDVLFGDFGRISGGQVLSGGDDRLFGKGGDDALLGQDGDDLVNGGAGSDTLTGDQGRDKLIGGAGADLLVGGTGGDTLAGGGGEDRFLWQKLDDLGTPGQRDQIWAFASGIDVMDLSQVIRESGVASMRWVGTDYVGQTGTIGFDVAGNRLKVRGNLDEDRVHEIVIFVGGTDTLEAVDFIL